MPAFAADPSPGAPRIRGLRRLEETTLRLGGVGDNWHMSWADDDRQYVSLCDGTGWPGMPQKQYLARLLPRFHPSPAHAADCPCPRPCRAS